MNLCTPFSIPGDTTWIPNLALTLVNPNYPKSLHFPKSWGIWNKHDQPLCNSPSFGVTGPPVGNAGFPASRFNSEHLLSFKKFEPVVVSLLEFLLNWLLPITLCESFLLLVNDLGLLLDCELDNHYGFFCCFAGYFCFCWLLTWFRLSSQLHFLVEEDE